MRDIEQKRMKDDLKITHNKTRNPNILVTGTPGTGKTTFCELLAEVTENQLIHVNVGDLVKKNKLYTEYDEEYECFVLDEDAVCDEIEEMMEKNDRQGGLIIDYHGCDFFPERWFDLVLVLRTDNSALYDRLVARDYSKKKLEDNMQCEIMQTILEEARESYSDSIIKEIHSNNVDDMEKNVANIADWFFEWISPQ
eukprot:Sdes_comp14243_c0_seq1m3444